MTHAACESKLRSVVRASKHSCPAIGRTIVYHAQAAHAFSAGIKCQHCSGVPYVVTVTMTNLCGELEEGGPGIKGDGLLQVTLITDL